MRSTLLFLLACSTGFAAAPNVIVQLRTAQAAPRVLEAVLSELGPGKFDCFIAHEDITPARLKQAQILFLEHPTPDSLARLKAPALEAIRAGLKVVTDVPDVVQRAWGIEVSLGLTQRVLPYFQNGGEENLRGFFLALYREAGAPSSLTIPPPKEMPKVGVYHPDAPRLFPDLKEYLAWYRAAKPQQGALAAVGFFHSYLKNGDLACIDAQLRALEKQGLAAAGVVGWPHHTLGKVFDTPADDPMKVFLTFTLSLSKPEDTALLEKQKAHVISLMTTRDSYAEWVKTERGVTPDRVATSLANPEAAGATDPLMVATTEADPHGGPSRTMPIAERVEMAARRARRWVTLAEKPNAEKRIAILYYNNPPGKGNIGASYLNLPPSIEAVLKTLQNEGYRVGTRVPPAEQILTQLEKNGRNIETWAPGELNRMIDSGGVTLLPVERYREWFNELPAEFRKQINTRWGQPEAAELMTWKNQLGKKYFVIPGQHLENVFLGPQLLRASFAEYTNVQHSGTLPPHHGYVAAYLYYRHQFKADVVIHMGRHGTLEWLPGKNAGQAGWDSSEVILGDLPNLNYYIMDGDGEAIQARRRAAAVDLSHLTPMLVRAGKEERFQALGKALSNWEQTRETSPLIAAEYAEAARREMKTTGLADQFKLDLKDGGQALIKVQDFLESIEDAPIPLGLPTLGLLPTEDRLRAALATFVESAFLPAELQQLSGLPEAWATAIFEGRRPEVPELAEPLRAKALRILDESSTWLAQVRESPARELAAMTTALRGEFIPSGLVGDPLKVPSALPTGRNLHQGDPAMIPTKAAWEVGKRMAQQLLDRHQQQHGRYPERISMVLWQGETGRHQGAMEAQALYLMGVEPEWNSRGVPDRLKLIPDAQLGRPRVNVVFTVSGLYRDGLADKILLLDRAARLAASAGDNALSRQNKQTEAALLAAGVDAEQAASVAGARVFTTAPGNYGFGLEKFVEQSRDQEEPQTMAQLYLTKMNFVYTEKAWGTAVPKLLESQLKGNEAIVHSRSSNLYGAVDNDDVYQWMGGLRIASASVGAKPELMMNNFRRAGQEKLEDARQFIATELNARNWNPQWIAELKKEGYSGARVMANSIEYLYGWQATAPETIAPEVWKKTYDVYVADEYKLGLKEFFDRANPAMRQNLLGRLLEVDRQGSYRFTPEERQRMVKEYVQLVSKNGVACSANTCGNRRLQVHVASEASQVMSSEAVADFKKQFQEATSPAPTLSKARPSRQPQADWLKGWKVKMIDLKNWAVINRKVITANIEWLALLLGGSWLLGGIIARLRPAAPPQELGLTEDA